MTNKPQHADAIERANAQTQLRAELEADLERGRIAEDAASIDPSAANPVVPGAEGDAVPSPTTLASSTAAAMDQMEAEHVQAAGLTAQQTLQIKTMIDQGVGVAMLKMGVHDLTITREDLIKLSTEYDVKTEPLVDGSGYTLSLVPRVQKGGE